MSHRFRVKIALFVILLLATFVLNISSTTNPQPVEAATVPSSLVRWGYYVQQSNSLASVQQNISSLNVLSPYYFGLNASGQIFGNDQAAVTLLAKSAGVKVIPMIQNVPTYDNFHNILANPTTVKNIIDQIDNLITYNGYDGINIDFEAVNATDRPLLTAFMAQLYARLHPKGKLVTEAVVAKYRDATTDYGGAYDYAGLSPYLDLAVVMTYDYHYATGADGPVAPINWVQSVMAYAVSQFGPGKVLMGIPFYGYDWNLSQGGQAHGDTYPDLMSAITQNNGVVGYDTTYQEPYADYVANGNRHRVWFENPRSLSAKLKVMTNNNIAGFAIWRMGQENPDFWPVLNGLSLPTTTTKAFLDSYNRLYFSATGHSLNDTHHFLSYWKAHGGLAQFGYPQTEELQEINPADGKTYIVQYFERARFEYHPEFKGTANEVELGLLGNQMTQNRQNQKAFQPISTNPNNKNCQFFQETGHSLCYSFLQYWQQHGGLAIYGYPISEEFTEVNPADGKSYIVQYFERNRFEYHPELKGTPYMVELGLLGNQLLVQKGWLW